MMENGNYNQKRLSASAIRKLAINNGPECLVAVPYLFYLLSDEANQIRQYSLNAIEVLSKHIDFTNDQVSILTSIKSIDSADYNRKIAS